MPVSTAGSPERSVVRQGKNRNWTTIEVVQHHIAVFVHRHELLPTVTQNRRGGGLVRTMAAAADVMRF